MFPTAAFPESPSGDSASYRHAAELVNTGEAGVFCAETTRTRGSRFPVEALP